jgi:hypothetical protein
VAILIFCFCFVFFFVLFCFFLTFFPEPNPAWRTRFGGRVWLHAAYVIAFGSIYFTYFVDVFTARHIGFAAVRANNQ